MNTAVGIAFLVAGFAIILVALALVVSQIISGRHKAGSPIAHTMAGFNWDGMAALANGIAAIFKALGEWPLSALLILLGLILDGVGVWVLAAKPF
jgi:hypothetical protein